AAWRHWFCRTRRSSTISCSAPVPSHIEKGFGTGAEQEIVEDLLVLQNQWRQAAGECEDHVQVAGGEKLTLTRGNPPFPGSDLTLRAVAIAAAVIRDGGTMPAT